ncbi:Tat pathway signal sequence domain protein [Allorhizocola rhizosphaerae]|uniref:exo-rhamnogalacturonan lyase family protein n=1 Tax=Allorhizocola rhizosphaerae TaxID=1872709 RepID=UPI000E3C8C43|nr:Tat pathway signal sequence domain protein [Allorhizocola rhizosphaerae]
MKAVLRWLSQARPTGVTWGVPWPRGAVPFDSSFGLGDVPVQSWVTATWPDGSVKWSAHAIGPTPAESLVLTPGAVPAASELSVRVGHSPVTVDTGVVRWVVPGGDVLLTSEFAREVRLVRAGQETPPVDEVVVEQDGPVRAVVRLSGRDFTVRLYFYAGASDVRIVHTFIYEAPLAGLGIRADVPMRDEPHDRHVRLAGPTGFLTEAVRGITGLRRDPGARFRAAQVQGRPCGPASQWHESVSRRTHLIPQWNDWTLDQNSADGFTLRKRTGTEHGWVTIPSSTRSAGYGYVGGISGGLGFGLRDFWKLHPTRLDIRNAATDLATATVWMWSPSAPPMDLRFYHDGLGQDTYAEQLEGLEITYEDYEPGFGDAYGIARTHELVLRVYPATPSGDELAAHAAALNDPALLVASPSHIKKAGVFGDWSLVDRSSPARAEIEDRLDFLFDFYVGQREQRRWYGFWDYGDVMHGYDPDRSQWRYDVGGYAWDNSELSPDLFFWYQFLRTGRHDVFRFAEAMTRHTGEVDVYHAGQWKGLGTRHNVQHWGCSAKQLRISSAIYRRIYYYLTADERTGDLLHELAEAETAFLALDPTRKVRSDVYSPNRNALAIGLGTDWGALAAAWLTEWERSGDERARAKLVGTMHDIGRLPHGFLTGEALFDLDTGRFDTTRDRISVSHLSAVFGLVEICSELISLVPDPGFERAWLDYCSLYLASPEEQERAVGHALRGISLIQAHSRLAAYAAARTGDDHLARLAWRAFRHDIGDQLNTNALQRQAHWHTTHVAGPTVLAPVDEIPYLWTNDAAQYGLAAIQNLALVPDHLDES